MVASFSKQRVELKLDHKGKVMGKISLDKFNKLNYQEIIAPVRYENALKAYYGLEDWREDYDELLYGKAVERVNIVEEN